MNNKQLNSPEHVQSLTDSFKEQHQQLVATILKACAVEKIYLLGSTLLTRRTESIFMPDAPSCRQGRSLPSLSDCKQRARP